MEGHAQGCSCGRHAVATESLEEVFFSSSKSVHKAVLTSDIKRLEELLSKRPNDVHLLDPAGYVPLLYIKQTAVLDMLVSYGADVEACTPQGKRTLLHRASIQGNAAVVARLLHHGAVIHTIDAEGCTAEDLARREGKMDVVELLTRQQP